MNYICMFLIAFMAAGCKPKSDSKPVASTPIAQTQSNMISASTTNVSAEDQDKEQTLAGYEKTEDDARAQADKQHDEEQLRLPDDKRDRTGYLSSSDVLVEKYSNMRMRMDATPINRKAGASIARELKVIDNGNIYGFDMGNVNYCKNSEFHVKKSSKNWVEFMDVCLNENSNNNQYYWMLYDRNKHIMTELYLMNGGAEFQKMRNKDPEIVSYKNGLYSVFYPHLKDTMSFNVSTLDGDCYWKSGEGDMDNAEKGCPVSNVRDRIENGTLQKSPPSSSAN